MVDTLMKRFGSWLGVWRGPATLRDESDAILQLDLRPFFDGEVMQVDASIIVVETTELISYGSGFWSLGRDGRVINQMFGNAFGFATLEEQPDDEDVLSMRGPLADNTNIVVTFRMEDDELHFSSGITVGYAAKSEAPRVTARLTHVVECGP